MFEAIPWGMLLSIVMLVFSGYCFGFNHAKGPRHSPLLWKFVPPNDPLFHHGRRLLMFMSVGIAFFGAVFLLLGVH
ncbi:hypothetical protein LNAOJCKE_0375 [Methylorubrum aminovorans]|uniref:Transmembrane protein n=1 Tax=Methylorubrum aminovorans TaxID=269069 RepID=A0ABQ4U7G3_9HYPH|nr:hypothetical protein [Methylorubrum aminovorans]GJE63181.1 hypothetical protein LNAOJCKE_0375 [Methylorubrum aminovorans]GMA79224.1 hypothetical protein GCM10025880_56410 [Methylorubrum aminovorans]